MLYGGRRQRQEQMARLRHDAMYPPTSLNDAAGLGAEAQAVNTLNGLADVGARAQRAGVRVRSPQPTDIVGSFRQPTLAQLTGGRPIVRRQVRRQAYLQEHPVLAARRAARASMRAARATGDNAAIAGAWNARRDAMQAARMDPNSAWMERRAHPLRGSMVPNTFGMTPMSGDLGTLAQQGAYDQRAAQTRMATPPWPPDADDFY